MSKQRFSSMVQNKLKSMLKHNQAFYFQNKQTNQVLSKPQSLKQIVTSMIDDKMQLVFQDDSKSKQGKDGSPRISKVSPRMSKLDALGLSTRSFGLAESNKSSNRISAVSSPKEGPPLQRRLSLIYYQSGHRTPGDSKMSVYRHKMLDKLKQDSKIATEYRLLNNKSYKVINAKARSRSRLNSSFSKRIPTEELLSFDTGLVNAKNRLDFTSPSQNQIQYQGSKLQIGPASPGC